MAYTSLKQVKEKEAGFLGLGQKNYRIGFTDRGSPITIATLVGGTIVPGISRVMHVTANHLGANTYDYGGESHVSVAEAQRLRVEPAANFTDGPLETMLKGSFGVFLGDAPNPGEQVYITGTNLPLATLIAQAMPEMPMYMIAGTGIAQGANNEQHPANRYTAAGGIEIQFSQGVLRQMTPPIINYFGQRLSRALQNYLDGFTPAQRQAALRPRGRIAGAQYDVQQRVHDIQEGIRRFFRGH